MTNGNQAQWRSRNIPWLNVVQFHKAIAARAEQSFFSLNAKDEQAERWSSLSNFNPDGLDGPWSFPTDTLSSRPFRLAVDQGAHDSIFIGGPGYVGWEKSVKGEWMPSWRPLFYREVKIVQQDGHYLVTPQQGAWSLTPLVYGMLSQHQVDVGRPVDELAQVILEKAAGLRTDGTRPWHECVKSALCAQIPEVEGAVRRDFKPGDIRVPPTPWVLFAATNKFSALTRHLMKDYEHLERLLTRNPSELGGLRILDAEVPTSEAGATGQMLPIVPLNDLQTRAVNAVLSDPPLTVISGPPGCGKSQVVVSILLNAWARGMSVLFASNNNSAVDVVRERLDRFESEFPIAVRAGNREKNNIIEVLRRTLNLASGGGTSDSSETDPAVLRKRRSALLAKKAQLLVQLESRQPQRLSEALATALRAYAEAKQRLAEIGQIEADLVGRKARLGASDLSANQVKDTIARVDEWISQFPKFQRLAREDADRRAEVGAEIRRIEQARSKTASEVGMEDALIVDWSWVIHGPAPNQIDIWERQLISAFDARLEEHLDKPKWHHEYDRWKDAESASNHARANREFSEEIRSRLAEIAPRVATINSSAQELLVQRRALETAQLEERDEISLPTLQAWVNAYAELATQEPTRLDFLPWSSRARLRRQLSGYESVVRSWIPLAKWREIGPLNEVGRSRLSETVETLRRWCLAKRKWSDLEPERSEVETTFKDLRTKAAKLGLDRIPTDENAVAWQALAGTCDSLASLAERASDAWAQRTRYEHSVRSFVQLARDWFSLASGQPIKVAWAKGMGNAFETALGALRSDVTVEAVSALRQAYYTGSLSRLKTVWLEILSATKERESRVASLRQIPDETFRIAELWQHLPPQAARFIRADLAVWPSAAECNKSMLAAREWLTDWERFESETKPQLESAHRNESQWAADQLKHALDLLPSDARSPAFQSAIAHISERPDSDWPVAELSEEFAAYSPDRIHAQIERLNGELERASFEDAKADWLERLRADIDGIKSLDALEKSLRRNHLELPEGDLAHFKAALRLVPVWITTAQAAQAIPLAADLFDVVVIDEASQCTLTNLLPLLYRGRRLAIIGDAEQLPAIPTIQEVEENVLAGKHAITDHLDLIAHTGNDVFKAACESLPRRRADVIHLTEHFRSNPQIIGFSNRHIYLQRLVLKKDPSKSASLPIGAGVHRVHVNGSAQPGERGRSWINRTEADAVLQQVQKIRETPNLRDRSLGVVTPFAAQKELLRDMLERKRLASDVLVDSAYGFQGDERDIIIFSPVVARGITPGACRWVESPPNLVNVAVTRARDALIVVADFDFCLQQDGILRKLALYCRDVQLLRDTSPAEVELFSWMVVQGWTPKVHPRIGDIEADFELQASSGQRIAIEVDGSFHRERKEEDKARDAFLHAQGYRVLRFPSRAVLETPYEIVTQIEKALQE